jgi:hypothetical protein
MGVRYCSNKSPPSVPILSHINPVYVFVQLVEDTYQYYPPIYACAFQNGPFRSGFSTKTLCTPLHTCYMHHPILRFIARIIFGEEYRNTKYIKHKHRNENT